MSNAYQNLFNILNPPPVTGVVVTVGASGVRVSTRGGVIFAQGRGLEVGNPVVVKDGIATRTRSGSPETLIYV